MSSPLRSLLKWLARLAAVVVFAWLVLVVGGAVQAALRLPDLQPWHQFLPPSELRAADMGPAFTLADYLEREARVFDEVARAIEAPLAGRRPPGVHRYVRESVAHPSRLEQPWNRTTELVPPGGVRGGALLVHGLTDSPYSLRAIAELLRDEGYYVLVMRMPGHGTVPAGLTLATWEDWLAAVHVGARHVRTRIGEGRPFVMVGYSNGGALVVKYAVDATADPSLPAPSKIVLLSPMIGVAPFAWLARTISRLAFVPGLEKAAWLDVIREYNPFKYNSFPTNAALQSYRLTTRLQADLAEAQAGGRAGKLPPILTFQSIVDATVSSEAVARRLYDRLDGEGHELVVFDINRLSGMDEFMRPADVELLDRLYVRAARPFRRVLVTNQTTETLALVERSIAANETDVVDRPLDIAWPSEVFSLSHVALPFAPDDPVYGYLAPATPGGPVRLGRWSPRGENSVLQLTPASLLRISSNPFFPYLAERVRAFVRLP